MTYYSMHVSFLWRLEWTIATWHSLVHRGKTAASAQRRSTPRRWNTQQWSETGEAFTYRLALAWWRRSGPVQARRHSPPMAARLSAEVLERLLRRCIRYRWSSATTLSTLPPAGCTVLSTQYTWPANVLRFYIDGPTVWNLRPADQREENEDTFRQ